jgi:hypothetical protein
MSTRLLSITFRSASPAMYSFGQTHQYRYPLQPDSLLKLHLIDNTPNALHINLNLIPIPNKALGLHE